MKEWLRRTDTRWVAAVFFSYVGLAVVMTWPLVSRLGTELPGADGDAWVHLWTFNWVKQSLLEGQNPLFTRLLYFPEGVSLLFHNIAWLNIAIWLPLQAIAGEAAAYSLMFLLIYAFNGLATYLLAQEVIGSRPVSFVSGLIVAFWPYILAHNNHPNLVLIGWVPLALLFLRRTIMLGKRKDALLAGLAIGLLGITRYQLLVIGGFLIGFYLLYMLLTEPLARTRRRLALLVLAGVVAAAVVTPVAAPVVIAQVTRADPGELFVEEAFLETDLLAYFVPNHRHPLWGGAFSSVYGQLGLNAKYVAYVGLTTLLLAIYGTVRDWRTARMWLLAALLYFILALGAELHVYGRALGIPLPYALIDDFFLVKLIRRSDRLNVILSIPVALLAGIGLAHLRQGLARRRPALVVAVAAALILAEYATIYLTMPLNVPQWFQELAGEPGEFAIISVPMHPRWGSDKVNMLYQLNHGKPLVEGHVSRPPEEAFVFIDSVPMLAQLKSGAAVPNLPDPGHQLRLLKEANVRYLVLHTDTLPEEVVAAWQEWLMVAPDYAQESLRVYRTDVVVDRDLDLAHTLVSGTSQLGIVRTAVVPRETTELGWVEVYVDWASGSALTEDYEVCLLLRGADGKQVKRQCLPLSGAWPTSAWQAGELVHERYLLQIDTGTAPGAYQLQLALALPSEQAASAGEPLVLGSVRVAELPRAFVAPILEEVVTASWEDQISLAGYDLAGAAGRAATLDVTLYWQATGTVQSSYKFFLHLLEPASGAIVAQADWVPRDWSYPTSFWQEGEYVEDTVRLELQAVPAGTYELVVGIYDPDTNTRLAITSPERRVSNGSLLLQEVTVE